MQNILFVCVENAGRSQMAEGFGNSFGCGKIKVFSAGSKPRKHVHEYAVEVMKEKRIDISNSNPDTCATCSTDHQSACCTKSSKSF